jgi:hypothetical protein
MNHWRIAFNDGVFFTHAAPMSALLFFFFYDFFFLNYAMNLIEPHVQICHRVSMMAGGFRWRPGKFTGSSNTENYTRD